MAAHFISAKISSMQEIDNKLVVKLVIPEQTLTLNPAENFPHELKEGDNCSIVLWKLAIGVPSEVIRREYKE